MSYDPNIILDTNQPDNIRQEQMKRYINAHPSFAKLLLKRFSTTA